MIRRPVYPFLFIAYVILTPLSVNLDQLDPAQALRPAAALLLLAAVCMLVCYALTRDWGYAGYLVTLGGLYFFAFAHLSRVLYEQTSTLAEPGDQLVALGIWTVLVIVLSLPWVWRRFKHQSWLVPFLNLVLIISLAAPVFSILWRTLPDIGARTASASPSPTVSEDHDLDCSTSPDIYYIILDGYGRQDVLEELYGVDNQPFIDYLESRGFYVAGDSHTNYVQTIYSIATGLNFEYTAPPSGMQNDAVYFRNRITHSELEEQLESCGYRVISNHSGFYFTEELAPGEVLTPSSDLTEFESLLLTGTPYQILASRLFQAPDPESYAAHRQRVRDSFTALGEAYRLPGPKLVFAHIISPHPPFVFDERGRAIDPKYLYSVNDGNEYPGTPDEYVSGYAGQVRFVNQQLRRVVDSLIENSPTPPVIILQGDHGPGLTMDWGSPYNTCLFERTSILNAYYLPGVDKGRLYPSISPVNSFRVVLNEYFGAVLPLLSDNTYFTSHVMRRRTIDITPLRSSTDNCPIP